MLPSPPPPQSPDRHAVSFRVAYDIVLLIVCCPRHCRLGETGTAPKRPATP